MTTSSAAPLSAERTSTMAVGVWLSRFLGSVLVMAAWLGMILLVTAFLLPANRSIDDELESGLQAAFPLHQFLGVITLAYFAGIGPLFVLPYNEDDRFAWFQVSAFGWMACLLGTIVYFWRANRLRIVDLDLPLSTTTTVIAILAIAVAALAIVFLSTRAWDRRVSAMIGLAIALVVLEGIAVAVPVPVSGPHFWNGLLVTLALVIMAVLLLETLPSDADFRHSAAGIVALLALFAIAAYLCLQVKSGRWTMALLERNPFQVTDLNEGRAFFHAIVATAFVAPFLSWLGVPWTRGKRPLWAACFGLAAAVVLGAAYFVPYFDRTVMIDGEKRPANIINHIYSHYDATGPHLFPR